MFNINSKSTEAKLVNDIFASYAVEIQRVKIVTDDFTKEIQTLTPQETAVVCFSAGAFNQAGGVLKTAGMEHLLQFIKMEVPDALKMVKYIDNLIDYVNNYQTGVGIKAKLEAHFEERREGLSKLEDDDQEEAA